MENFESIIAPLVTGMSQLPAWCQPGSDLTVIADRLLANPDSLREFIYALGNTASTETAKEIHELILRIDKVRNLEPKPLSFRAKLRELITGMPAELLTETRSREFAVIVEDYDKLINVQLNTMSQNEQLSSWLQEISRELESRKTPEAAALVTLFDTNITFYRMLRQMHEQFVKSFLYVERELAYAKAVVDYEASLEAYVYAKFRASR